MKDDATLPLDRRRRQVRIRTAAGSRDPRATVPAWDGPGDPTQGGQAGGALLTVSNADGTGEHVAVGLPARNWRRLGSAAHPRGYLYEDRARADGPITRVVVDRRGTIAVRGGGPGWGYTLDEPAQGRIAVRLRLGRGEVWCTTFTARSRRSGGDDRPGRFVGARQSTPPSDCPPRP